MANLIDQPLYPFKTQLPRSSASTVYKHILISPSSSFHRPSPPANSHHTTPRKMSLSLLHSTSLPLWHFSGLMSLFPLTLGLIGLHNPASGFRLFSLPLPASTTPESTKLATNLLLFWVSRDLYMAATCMAAYAGGSRITMGWIYIAGAGVAVCDGWMSQRQIGRDAWKHTMWVPVVVGIGGGLLGWWDRWVG